MITDALSAICDRQREEEKRRRRKEKEEAKAQERRRNSTSASVGFPSPNPGGQYPTSPYVGTAPTSPYVGTAPYSARDRKPSYSDLSAQFNDINITGRPRKYSTSEGAAPMGSGGYGQYGTVPGPYSKPYAAAGPHISAYSNPSPNMRAADVLPSVPQPGYPASPYTSTGKNSEPIARASSPYGYTQPPRSRATTPIPGAAPSFPQPRSRAASPVPGYAQPRSRAASPMPGGMPLPPEASFDRHQPTIPDCFSRPLNTTHSYPAFDPIKIQEMDEFLERLPKLPLVLQSHDVTHHDWIRLTQVHMCLWISFGIIWLIVNHRICLLPGLEKCLFLRRGPRTRRNVQTLWLSSSMLGTHHFLCLAGLRSSSTRVAPGSQDQKLGSLIYQTNTMKTIQMIPSHLRRNLQRTSISIILSQWVYMAALTQCPRLRHQYILLSRAKAVEGVARKKSVAARRSA